MAIGTKVSCNYSRRTAGCRPRACAMSLMMLMSSEKLGRAAGSLQQRRIRALTAGSTVDGMSSCRLPQPTAPTTCCNRQEMGNHMRVQTERSQHTETSGQPSCHHGIT